jgi:hypothetical protein
MTGDRVGEMRGIIPRSVEQIIERVILMRESGWEIVVTASMVRTYINCVSWYLYSCTCTDLYHC